MRDYLARLADTAELAHLLRQITAGERRFYRYSRQLDAFRRVLVPAFQAAPRRDKCLRVGNIGCGGGEDAYTLAMVLQESSRDDWTFDIHALDADQCLLARAREAVYPASALARVPPHCRQKYFSALPEERFALGDVVRSRVRFSPGDLAALASPPFEAGMDVIVCREVLVHFDAATRRRALRRLADALNAGGYLFLAPAESTAGAADHGLRLIHFPAATAYRKPASASLPGLS